MAIPDVTAMSDADLQSLALAVNQEQSRRFTVARAQTELDRIVKDYQTATGTTRADGATWKQPTGALDAYPTGAVVTLDGTKYTSLIPANTTKPGDKNDPQAYRWWKAETTASTGSGPQAWDGNGHAYAAGDVVTYNGKTYKVLQAHTSQPGWMPSAVPSLYQETK